MDVKYTIPPCTQICIDVNTQLILTEGEVENRNSETDAWLQPWPTKSHCPPVGPSSAGNSEVQPALAPGSRECFLRDHEDGGAVRVEVRGFRRVASRGNLCFAVLWREAGW